MSKKRSNRQLPQPDRISGLQSTQDRRQIRDVFVRAFSNPVPMENHMERGQWHPLVFDPEHTRIVVVDGQVVSGVAMGPRMIRFGPVTVPAMTLGPVGTHEKHRKRGYSAASMNDASDYMARAGVLVAYLQGIPNFYYRFGYYPYMAPGRAKFGREAAKKESLPGRLRKMTRAELPKVRRIYDATTSTRVCAAARDDRIWDWLLRAGTKTWLFMNPKVITDDRGRIVGYIASSANGTLDLRELIVRQDERSCRVALGALVRETKRLEIKEIQCRIPWDDAMAVFLRQFVGAQFTMDSNPTGGALMKIVNFPALMLELQPLFRQRWQEARSDLRPARFALASELGKIEVAVSRSTVRVTEQAQGSTRVFIPQRWLSGLVTGYYGVRNVRQRKGVKIPGRLIPLLDILFPTGWPFIYQGDNY